MTATQPATDGEYDDRNFFQKAFYWCLGEDSDQPEPQVQGQPRPAEQAAPRKQQQLRVTQAMPGRVAVRRNAQDFNDAKISADGLKSGEQQIVNLERATPEMAERIIDFLNGVCYALDGSVEKVGERVYMFVPANVVVDIDEGSVGAPAPNPSPAAANYRRMQYE